MPAAPAHLTATDGGNAENAGAIFGLRPRHLHIHVLRGQ